MKLIVAGTRYIKNPDNHQEVRDYTKEELAAIFEQLDIIHAETPITMIVSGGARGADAIGEYWANSRKIPVEPFKVSKEEWAKSKAAGHLRNARMAEFGDELLLIWDGISTGSKNMLENMKKRDKPYKVFYVYF